MTEQTVELLDECSSGCKMAINSMKQILDFIKDEKLEKIIRSYTEKHQKLERETGEQLNEYGRDEEKPGLVASAMSWISTEAKLMINGNAAQIAKIIMDGCNMGIQSIGKRINECISASEESISLAKRLVRTEEDLMLEMKQFL